VNISDSETVGLNSTTADVEVLPTCSVGDVLSDRYRLDEEIGRGGMGVVFRGWDSDLERSVAVKILGAHHQVGDARERLFREARAAAALSHPHVVAVHDVGEHRHMPYLVMELIEGPSLKERKPESLEESIEFATQLCGALEHAHQHGLVHRDLKPANVLLANSSGDPSVKLVDLGLAVRERAVRITREGGITGTVAYMAPEQALGKEVDGRTDLYALGVMLYEFTTGRLPFDGDNPLSVLSQHLHAPVVPPRTYRANIPEHIEAAILRLLAKDPDDRFATATEVAAVLTQSPEAAAVPTPAGVSAALGGLVRGRMVGRDTEINSLRRSWSETSLGRGGMVLVSGEPGSGKTRLARELIDYACITGGTVLSGGCYELEAATPYLPFIEALRSWVHQSTDDELREAAGDSGAELARLAPELESRIGPFPEGPTLSASEERLRLYDGVARCLFHLAGPSGLLLFIDDLQWADQASLSLLHYLVRLAGRERLLVLGCYRDTDLDRSHPLSEALDLWNRERAAVRVHLGRLGLEGTSAMSCLATSAYPRSSAPTSTARPRATRSLSKRSSRPWSTRSRSSASAASGGAAKRMLTSCSPRASRPPSAAGSTTSQSRPPRSCAAPPSSAKPSSSRSSRRSPSSRRTSSSTPSTRPSLRSSWRPAPARPSSSPTTRSARSSTTS
jgi:hypothetical protein